MSVVSPVSELPLAAPPAETAPLGARELDRSLLRGIAWTGAMRWATQLLSWASTLIVARLLAPTDYGLVGMAMVYLGLIQLVNEFGLGAAIVTCRDLTTDQIARLGGLALLLGVGFVALSAALAAPVAGFFDEAAVRGIILVSSVTFLTGAVQVVPRALLVRDLDFRRLAWADGAEAVIATCVTLALAALGFKFWALVLGPLTGRATGAFLVRSWRPHRVAWPGNLKTIAGPVSFGWHVVVSRIAWYLYSNADFAVVGRFLGKAALGAYTLGWTISSIPIDRVTALVASVTPPVFSAVQRDPPALQRYLARLTEGLAFITFPACAGIALVADQFVLLALGEHWRPAITPLRLLAVSAALRSVSPLLPQVIVSTGHARRNMQLTILATLILPGLFYVGAHWGTAGVAAAWVVGYPVCVMPLFLYFALRHTGLSFTAYLRALSPAAGATLAMAVAVLGLRWGIPATWPLLARLAGQVATGAVVYAAVLYYGYRARVRALWALFRELRS
jgi:PST family polysaccharide transporter